MIEFEDIDKRLTAMGKDRVWLSREAGYSEAAVREALAPNSKKRSGRLQLALSEAIEKEEARQKATTPPLQNLVLEVDVETFERWSRAGLAAGEIVTEYAIRAIEEAAARDAEGGAVLSFPSKRETISRVAEGTVVRFPAVFRGSVAAGEPTEAAVEETVMLDHLLEPGHYLLRVNGTSMEPTIADASLIEVRSLREGEYAKQKSIVVYTDGTGATLKRLAYRKPQEGEEEMVNNVGKVAVLQSDNPAFKEVQTMETGKIVAVYVDTISEG